PKLTRFGSQPRSRARDASHATRPYIETAPKSLLLGPRREDPFGRLAQPRPRDAAWIVREEPWAVREAGRPQLAGFGVRVLEERQPGEPQGERLRAAGGGGGGGL